MSGDLKLRRAHHQQQQVTEAKLVDAIASEEPASAAESGKKPDSSSLSHDEQQNATAWFDAVQMALCVVSIYICYIGHGLFHEKITKQPYVTGELKEKFTHTGFFTMLVCFGNMCWALLLLAIEAGRRFARKSEEGSQQLSYSDHLSKLVFDDVPKKDYALIAFSYSMAMYSSTAALKFVSYPVQALAKSSKLIPVMVGRILIGCKYSLREYFHVACITGGIAMYFMFDDAAAAAAAVAAAKTAAVNAKSSFIDDYFGGTVFGMSAPTFFGVALLGLSLTMDAITGPKQESVSKKYNPHVMSMAFWINIFPACVMLALEFNSGAFASAVQFVMRHPDIRIDLIASCFCSAVGQSVIIWGLFKFNSMTITIITTIRKFFTILASVFWFENILNFYQWCAVLLVFLGVGLDTQFKFARRKQVANKAA